MNATNINSFVNNAQIAIPGLDITTAGDTRMVLRQRAGHLHGTMSVTVQSSNLSLLSPKLQVYSSSLGLVGQAGTVASLGATVTVQYDRAEPVKGITSRYLRPAGPGRLAAMAYWSTSREDRRRQYRRPNTVVAAATGPEQVAHRTIMRRPRQPRAATPGRSLFHDRHAHRMDWMPTVAACCDWGRRRLSAATTQVSDTANALEIVIISTAGSTASTQDGCSNLSIISAASASTSSTTGASLRTASNCAVDCRRRSMQ